MGIQRPGTLEVGSLASTLKKHHPEVPIANALVEEHDRGCILVGCAYLEYLLERLLRAYLSFEAKQRSGFNDNDIDLVEKVLNPKDPMALLGSGWAKSTIAYMLGQLNRFAYEGFDKIRRMRVECAHHVGTVPLDESLISELMKSIEANDPESMADINGEVIRFFDGGESVWHLVSGHRDFSSPRIKFMHACLRICTPMSFKLMSYTNPGVTAFHVGTFHSSPHEVIAIERYSTLEIRRRLGDSSELSENK
jgi:hypothetical protein